MEQIVEGCKHLIYLDLANISGLSVKPNLGCCLWRYIASTDMCTLLVMQAVHTQRTLQYGTAYAT